MLPQVQITCIFRLILTFFIYSFICGHLMPICQPDHAYQTWITWNSNYNVKELHIYDESVWYLGFEWKILLVRPAHSTRKRRFGTLCSLYVRYSNISHVILFLDRYNWFMKFMEGVLLIFCPVAPDVVAVILIFWSILHIFEIILKIMQNSLKNTQIAQIFIRIGTRKQINQYTW